MDLNTVVAAGIPISRPSLKLEWGADVPTALCSFLEKLEGSGRGHRQKTPFFASFDIFE